MSDNMNEKYQQHYNKILTGTLTDTMMKNISYQANIQLANDIIAEQEKTILDLQSTTDTSKKELQNSVESLKSELESLRNNKVAQENSKISSLENTIKTQQNNISKLTTDLYEVNKLKTEYENVKHQVQHLDTYRNEVVKANEVIKSLKEQHNSTVGILEEKIRTIMVEISELKTPAPTKKAKVKKVVETPKAKIIKQDLPGLILKDGGSF